jgi:hypothetical protein
VVQVVTKEPDMQVIGHQDSEAGGNGTHRDGSLGGFTWAVDGEEFVVVQSCDLPDTTAEQVEALMVALECSELEAWHALRIIREDGEFVMSVSADIDDLPQHAA